MLTGGAPGLERESPELYYSRGNLADNKQEWDKAIGYYQKALSLDDKYTDAYLGLGGDYYEKGQYDLEVENYEKACLADPQRDEAFYFLATAYEEKPVTLAPAKRLGALGAPPFRVPTRAARPRMRPRVRPPRLRCA